MNKIKISHDPIWVKRLLRYKALFVSIIMTLSSAQAGEAIDRLNQYTSNLKTLHANFTQTLFDEQMRQVEVSSGVVNLKKPGKFRWDYQKPYEQTIVSDGEKLWLYDVELEQATVKPLSEALGAAPIALLTTNEPLDQQFNIIELGEIDKRLFVQLEAKVKDTDYAYMLLALGKQGLEAMELKDQLGQVTRIEFEAPMLNKKIDDAVFKFKPPKGADVIGKH